MKPRVLTRAAVGAVASVAALMPLAGCSSDSNDSADIPPPSTAPRASSPSSSDGTYQDGTYTARGAYKAPISYMDFTVTLEGGVIKDVESELTANTDRVSRRFQERFAAALPDEVEGRSIDGLQVGVIAGASRCADGFNDALDKIRAEAQTDQ